jgi:catechol 2,3-dioxygenase-like lactoylglutathione lyase family enzyme
MLNQHRTHTTIPAADLDRARSWYSTYLGFEPKLELSSGILYDVNGSRFVIYPTPNAGQSPNTLMGWSVADIEAEVAELKARGVVFEEYDLPGLKTVDSIADNGPARAAWMKDSEGNLLGIVQLPELAAG